MKNMRKRMVLALVGVLCVGAAASAAGYDGTAAHSKAAEMEERQTSGANHDRGFTLSSGEKEIYSFKLKNSELDRGSDDWVDIAVTGIPSGARYSVIVTINGKEVSNRQMKGEACNIYFRGEHAPEDEWAVYVWNTSVSDMLTGNLKVISFEKEKG